MLFYFTFDYSISIAVNQILKKMFWLYGPLIIVLNNLDYNIDQNNRDYDFCHNQAALV